MPEVMERMKRFLNAHQDKNIIFSCDDRDPFGDCTEFEEPIEEEY